MSNTVGTWVGGVGLVQTNSFAPATNQVHSANENRSKVKKHSGSKNCIFFIFKVYIAKHDRQHECLLQCEEGIHLNYLYLPSVTMCYCLHLLVVAHVS